MKLFVAMGLLMVLLVGADMLLNRRRRRHDERVRQRMAAYARRVQKNWDSRPK